MPTVFRCVERFGCLEPSDAQESAGYRAGALVDTRGADQTAILRVHASAHLGEAIAAAHKEDRGDDNGSSDS
jgi:hypothetical protein